MKKNIEIEPLFNIGDIVILKDNLLAVEIKDIFVKAKRYCYHVRYHHKNWANNIHGWFAVFEDELMGKPYNYESLLIEKYIEYRYKYEQLLIYLAGKK